MYRPWTAAVAVAFLFIGGVFSSASASILGHHAFSWWDDPQLGVLYTPLGSGPPTPIARHLLDLEEWHLDQVQTTQWYSGAPVAGLPANPFNPAVRTGLIGGIVPIGNAEGFIYEITNVNYWSGNGTPAVNPVPFSFTTPPTPGTAVSGVNDLSGINIIDGFGALNIASPVVGSQFMFTTLGAAAPSAILDLTPGSVPRTPQDWDFNAFSGSGNFEWDIQPINGAGVVNGFPPAVFGYAMPGIWLDAVEDGWVHSWGLPPLMQVNIAWPGASGIPGGFSGPRPIPEPASVCLWLGLAVAGWGFVRIRRR